FTELSLGGFAGCLRLFEVPHSDAEPDWFNVSRFARVIVLCILTNLRITSKLLPDEEITWALIASIVFRTSKVPYKDCCRCLIFCVIVSLTKKRV
ncbi:hypothetical protein MKW98_005651, partial [Papaver atlanticum]